MPRYIDAEKYVNIIKADIADSYTIGLGQSSLSKERLRAFEDIIDDLETLETEDVVPVVHAKWVDNGANYKCSNCGKTESYYDMLYCPRCGAKMDKKGD